MVKNPPAKAGDTQEMGSIPRSVRSPGGRSGKSTPVFILAWKIPGTEAPGGLQCMGSQTAGYD